MAIFVNYLAILVCVTYFGMLLSEKICVSLQASKGADKVLYGIQVLRHAKRKNHAILVRKLTHRMIFDNFVRKSMIKFR